MASAAFWAGRGPSLLPMALLISSCPTMAAALTVITTPSQAQHQPPPRMPHPEIPERVEAATRALQASSFASSVRWASPSLSAAAAETALRRVHSDAHVDAVQRMAAAGGGGFDADTYCAPGSWAALTEATGAWVDAVAMAAKSEGPAFALARPPGHHATARMAMGFCLVNFACAAVRSHLDSAAPAPGSSERVEIAVLDWDVHHGNGVADILAAEPRARYCSTHEAGGFPGTGFEKVPSGEHRNLLHLPLPPESGGPELLDKLREKALPFLLGDDPEKYPDVLLICAGFDALSADPLAGMTLSPADFAKAVRLIVDDFGFPSERIALGLEGGYSLDEVDGMPAAVVATCGALLE